MRDGEYEQNVLLFTDDEDEFDDEAP